MKKRGRTKRHHKKLPFWKEKWFLMLMGLAVFTLVVLIEISHKTSDVLGIFFSN